MVLVKFLFLICHEALVLVFLEDGFSSVLLTSEHHQRHIYWPPSMCKHRNATCGVRYIKHVILPCRDLEYRQSCTWLSGLYLDMLGWGRESSEALSRQISDCQQPRHPFNPVMHMLCVIRRGGSMELGVWAKWRSLSLFTAEWESILRIPGHCQCPGAECSLGTLLLSVSCERPREQWPAWDSEEEETAVGGSLGYRLR